LRATTTHTVDRADDRPRRPGWRIAALIAFEALTVGLFSALHLSGTLHVGSTHATANGAGIAEAMICLALIAGAVGLVRASTSGAQIALACVAFAILGFIVGLSFTAQGGDTIDLAYHATTLPVLIGTAIVLVPATKSGGAR
jgi:hypothetical protein